MFEEIYNEIKYPYTKINLSYKIFNYANYLLVLYFILTYFNFILAIYFKIKGNIKRFNILISDSFNFPIILGLIIITSYIISIVFRKKI